MDALTDKKIRQEKLLRLGAPTMSLEKFYTHVLSVLDDDASEKLETLLTIGLQITNKHDGPVVSQNEILDNLEKKVKLETIEGFPLNFTVNRFDIEDVYCKAGETTYPWISMSEGEIVLITIEDQIIKQVALGNQVEKEQEKPWLIPDPNDPIPELLWYIPARYFARNLIKDDSTLLIKRNTLANKIVVSLTNVGINKRGGKKPYSPVTIKKALSNVLLG
jgi:hypothetical protein